MTREERRTYNALKKSVTTDTICVDVLETHSHEARQAIHELLTIEKGMYAVRINWIAGTDQYSIHYAHACGDADSTRQEQETADIDDIIQTLHRSDYSWNGYKRPAAEDAETVTLAPADLPAEDCTWGDEEAHDNDEKEEEKTMKKNIVEIIRAELTAHKDRSAWERGVTAYALDMLDELAESIRYGYHSADDISAPKVLEKMLLNGAQDWEQYSWGGCALCYDYDIAARLCTPSELKKTRNGERRPNAREEWLDVQAHALYQAAKRIKIAARHATTEAV